MTSIGVTRQADGDIIRDDLCAHRITPTVMSTLATPTLRSPSDRAPATASTRSTASRRTRDRARSSASGFRSKTRSYASARLSVELIEQQRSCDAPCFPGLRQLAGARAGRVIVQLSEEGASSSFSPLGDRRALPREESWHDSCDQCERHVERREGPKASRRYRFVARGIAEALHAVGAGATYLRASQIARDRAHRFALTPRPARCASQTTGSCLPTGSRSLPARGSRRAR
jgi:hypothetical protein